MIFEEDSLVDISLFKYPGQTPKYEPGAFVAQPAVPLREVSVPTPYDKGGVFVTRSAWNAQLASHGHVRQWDSHGQVEQVEVQKIKIGPGADTSPRRNFQWLKWFPGAVSHVPLDKDVLTGPMSGCWLVIFRLNGVVQGGHIGTAMGGADAPTAETLAAKAAWKQWAAAHAADVLKAFQPCKGEQDPVKKKGDRSWLGTKPSYWGLMEKNGPKLYSIATYRQDCEEPIHRIARITEFTSVLPNF